MKRVKQFERTDRDIRDAFLKILKQKSFEKITVQEIIEEAMINRSTFYQHFEDKYAIVEQLQKKFVKEITDEVEAIRVKGKLPLEEIDRMMEEYFRMNKEEIKLLVKIRTEHMDFHGVLKQLFMEYFLESFGTREEIESSMMLGMFFDYFLYYLDHDEITGSFSSSMFQNFFNTMLLFFRINPDSEAERELMGVLKKYAGGYK